MKASRWVLGFLGVVVLLAGCGGSSGDSTLAVETVARETVPIPADTFAATTTLAPTMLLPTSTTAVPSTTLASDSEEALRARLNDFHRAFVEEDLASPTSDLERLRKFFVSRDIADEVLVGLIDASNTGGSTRRNETVVDEFEIKSVAISADRTVATVISCSMNNFVTFSGGPDRLPNTVDDVLKSDSLGTITTKEQWQLVDRLWMLAEVVDSKVVDGRVPCVG